MQEFKSKVQAIIREYEEFLSENGVKITVSKKYFETKVSEYFHSNSPLFNAIDAAIARKKEKEKGYHYQRNKYHCIVLSLLPVDKNLVRREYCKEYAFVLRKVERAHIGQAPERIFYEEDKVLAKIEKRIQKIIKSAEKESAQKVCKDTVCDIFRYTTLPKYAYKEKILGKDRSSWELLFLIPGILLLVGACIYGAIRY